MPRGDGTGPLGEGPMTGRGLGHCAGYSTPGCTRGVPRGRRRFPRRRVGRGRGRGIRIRERARPAPVRQRPVTRSPITVTEEEEKEILGEEIEDLKKEKEYIEKEIKELKEEMSESE